MERSSASLEFPSFLARRAGGDLRIPSASAFGIPAPAEPTKECTAARDRCSSPPQQAPCIIRNRPIKAFDQAPLHRLGPCYRCALAFLSSPPTWRLSLQTLPCSLLFPRLPPPPRLPPVAPLPRHSRVVAASPRVSPPTLSPPILLLLFLLLLPSSSFSSFSFSYSFPSVSDKRGRKSEKGTVGKRRGEGRGGEEER